MPPTTQQVWLAIDILIDAVRIRMAAMAQEIAQADPASRNADLASVTATLDDLSGLLAAVKETP